jgi:hypothetical protein
MGKPIDQVQESREEKPREPNQRKEQSINYLMLEFYNFFEGRIPVTSCGKNNASSTSRAANSTPNTTFRGNASNEKRGKRKLDDQSGEQRDEDGEDASQEKLRAYTHIKNFKYIKQVLGGVDESLADGSCGVDGILIDLGMSSMQVKISVKCGETDDMPLAFNMC